MQLLRTLSTNRNLLKNLIIRDLKHRYVGSVGGILWSVVHPVVLLISYAFVFTVALRQQANPEEYGTTSFTIFLFCGLLPWTLFQDIVMRSCSAITDNATLITKTIMPAEILPVAIAASTLVTHLIGMAILLAVLVIFQTVTVSALAVLLYLPILILFALGLGWFVAGLHVFLRDTIQALQIILFLGMWLTPVIYPLSRVHEYEWIITLNPMAIVVGGYRSALLGTAAPSAGHIAYAAVLSFAVFLGGGLIFRQTKPAFADVL